MHEIHQIERDLRGDAERISANHADAPVIIIVGGSEEAGVPRCMLASTLHGSRLRDLLGILETAKQIVTMKHFGTGQFSRQHR